MVAFVETWESLLIGETLPEPARTWILENDPLALEAEFRSAFVEGSISQDLSKWNVPCLICAGEEDEMHENAFTGGGEIPGATFVSLPGHTHFSAESVADQLHPRVLELFRSAAP